MTTLPQAEAALERVLERIKTDPKSAQAEALETRAQELDQRAERLRDEARGLWNSARTLRKEVDEDHALAEAKADVALAREAQQETEAEAALAKLKANRAAWLKDGSRVTNDGEFGAFCLLGLPGLKDSNGYPLAHGRIPFHTDRPKNFVADPAPAKPMPPKQKAGAFMVRTVEVPQDHSTRTFWVAFNAQGQPVAYMEATKYGHARDLKGQDLKTPDGKDALTWPRSKHAAGPKVRFVEALERAFPQVVA